MSRATPQKLAHVLNSLVRVSTWAKVVRNIAHLLLLDSLVGCFATATMEEQKKTRFLVCHCLGAWDLVVRAWSHGDTKRGQNTRDNRHVRQQRETLRCDASVNAVQRRIPDAARCTAPQEYDQFLLDETIIPLNSWIPLLSESA